ncbi:MAG: MBL fold metallo-hydrolase [Eubacterium sp.]|nr:MBL fold metallo-hydrolase [Eubacterium sp.]
MKITMLGTGNALVTECYNTCFVIEDDGQYFLVDGGGGNGLLRQLKSAGLDWKKMQHIFVTHKHLDHIMGIVWMIRMITQYITQNQYEGDAYIYGHDEVITLLAEMADKLLKPKQTKLIGKRLHLITLSDGEEFQAIGHRFQAFDIRSTKAKQFGFTMYYDENDKNGSSNLQEHKLTCCGDEPYQECEKKYAKESDWLLHEAFCLSSQADVFHPYEKHHSTVKDACTLAEELGVKNLVLYHTEDQNIKNRRKLYTEEGRKYYSGKLYVPEDLEVIEICRAKCQAN